MAKINHHIKIAVKKLYIADSEYSASSLAKLFDISPNTVLEWIKADKETDHDWDEARNLHQHFANGSEISISQSLQFINFQIKTIMDTHKETTIDSKSADVLIKLQKLQKELRNSDQIITAFESLKKFAAFLHKINKSTLANELSEYVEIFIQDRVKEYIQ